MKQTDHSLSLTHSRSSESDLRSPSLVKLNESANVIRSCSVEISNSDEELRSPKFKSDKSLDHISEDIGSCCSSLSYSSSSVGESATSSCGYGSYNGGLNTSTPPSRSGTPCATTISSASLPTTPQPPRSGVRQFLASPRSSCMILSTTSLMKSEAILSICPEKKLPVGSETSIRGDEADEKRWSSQYQIDDGHVQTQTRCLWPSSLTNKLKREITAILVRPMNSLESELLLDSSIKLPLRRYQSVVDLRHRLLGSAGDDSRPMGTIRRRHSESALDSLQVPEVDEAWVACSSDQADDGYGSYGSTGGSPTFKRSESSNLYELKRIRQRNYLRSKQNHVHWSPRIRARLLIERIKLQNPVSVAMQLTAIDKDLYLQISPMEVVKLILGKRYAKNSWNLNGIRTLMEFGDQIMQIVCNVIRREISSESRARKIAAFIEVACVLRRIRNWNSLAVIIKALQAPLVYFMVNAWIQVREQYPIHFRDYVKLSCLVNRSDYCILKPATNKLTIPNLHSLIYLLKIRCAAKFDYCENRPKWTEPPSLAGWIDCQIAGSLVKYKDKLMESNEDAAVASLNPGTNTLLPEDDPVRHLSPSYLPTPWTLIEISKTSALHRATLIRFIVESFGLEMQLMRRYKMRRTIDNL